MEGSPWAGVPLALFLAALMTVAEVRTRSNRHAGEVGSNSTGAGHRENPGTGPSKTTHGKDDRT